MANLLRYLDLALLAVALPVFIAADFPMAGYLAIVGVWILIYGVELISNRAIEGAVAKRDRRAAMGWLGATGLARAWIVALGVLIIGLAAGKDAGLAAAVLAAILFTVHFGARLLLRLTEPREPV
jgi:diacylglycerol kinase